MRKGRGKRDATDHDLNSQNKNVISCSEETGRSSHSFNLLLHTS